MPSYKAINSLANYTGNGEGGPETFDGDEVSCGETACSLWLVLLPDWY